jgi:integrase
MRLTTSIPQKPKKYKELPLPQKIYEAVRGTDIELPVLLSMWLSFSKSEIRGIKKSDIKDGVLTLQRSIVDVNNKPVEKKQLKAYERIRRHVIPPYIMDLINKCDTEYIVTLDSYQINYRWKRALVKNGLPHIPFHDLRHVNASVMHLLGIPDKYAMERGGWKTDAIMKAVYQNVFTDERINVDKKVNGYFDKIVGVSTDTISHNISHDIEKSP